MKRNKILFISDALTRPLYAPRVRYLCDFLSEQGMEVTLISEDAEDVPFDFNYRYEAIRFYKKGRFDWFWKNVLNFLIDYKNRWFSRAVNSREKNGEYDVVVCSVFHSFGLRAARDFARRRGIPLVVDIRDMAEQCEGNMYNRSGIARWPIVGTIYERLSIRRRNEVLRDATRVMSVSPWHVEKLNTWNDNVHLVYNGYDEKIFRPIEKRVDTFEIVYAGKWYGEAMQDPRLLFEAVSRLKEELVEMRLRWIVNDEVHEELRRMAKEYGIEDVMEVNGYVPNEEVPNILNRSSMLVVLSNVGTHGVMTTKLFEAIGVGKPVIYVRSDEGAVERFIERESVGKACRTEQDVERWIRRNYEIWKQTGVVMMGNEVERERFSRRTTLEGARELINETIASSCVVK